MYNYRYDYLFKSVCVGVSVNLNINHANTLVKQGFVIWHVICGEHVNI